MVRFKNYALSVLRHEVSQMVDQVDSIENVKYPAEAFADGDTEPNSQAYAEVNALRALSAQARPTNNAAEAAQSDLSDQEVVSDKKASPKPY